MCQIKILSAIMNNSKSLHGKYASSFVLWNGNVKSKWLMQMILYLPGEGTCQLTALCAEALPPQHLHLYQRDHRWVVEVVEISFASGILPA